MFLSLNYDLSFARRTRFLPRGHLSYMDTLHLLLAESHSWGPAKALPRLWVPVEQYGFWILSHPCLHACGWLPPARDRRARAGEISMAPRRSAPVYLPDEPTLAGKDTLLILPVLWP